MPLWNICTFGKRTHLHILGRYISNSFRYYNRSPSIGLSWLYEWFVSYRESQRFSGFLPDPNDPDGFPGHPVDLRQDLIDGRLLVLPLSFPDLVVAIDEGLEVRAGYKTG